jgi:hypothetical protein
LARSSWLDLLGSYNLPHAAASCPALEWSRTASLLASLDERVAEKAAGGLISRRGLEDRVGEEQVHMRYGDNDDEIVFERVGRTFGQATI